MPGQLAAVAPETGTPTVKLSQGWAIQSSAEVREGGAAVSTVGFKADEWYPATVPSTVLAALVQQRVYPDPYRGMNLRSIAGTSYPIGDVFTSNPMPPDSPFRHAWRYRTEFKLAADYQGKRLSLGFDGSTSAPTCG